MSEHLSKYFRAFYMNDLKIDLKLHSQPRFNFHRYTKSTFRSSLFVLTLHLMQILCCILYTWLSVQIAQLNESCMTVSVFMFMLFTNLTANNICLWPERKFIISNLPFFDCCTRVNNLSTWHDPQIVPMRLVSSPHHSYKKCPSLDSPQPPAWEEKCDSFFFH